MVKNYFIVGIRYLMRHRLYTFINLFGLGLGIACCLMMALFVNGVAVCQMVRQLMRASLGWMPITSLP